MRHILPYTPSWVSELLLLGLCDAILRIRSSTCSTIYSYIWCSNMPCLYISTRIHGIGKGQYWPLLNSVIKLIKINLWLLNGSTRQLVACLCNLHNTWCVNSSKKRWILPVSIDLRQLRWKMRQWRHEVWQFLTKCVFWKDIFCLRHPIARFYVMKFYARIVEGSKRMRKAFRYVMRNFLVVFRHTHILIINQANSCRMMVL